jgi:ferredoxin
VPGIRPTWSRNKNPAESRAVFVDEQSCIGCKNCMWCAPATFRVEEAHGRSRVFAQWLDTEEDLNTAILSCPVDCIHWVDKADLAALEFVCQTRQKRVNVSVMQSQGGRSDDVFTATEKFLKERRALEAKRKAASASPMQVCPSCHLHECAHLHGCDL